MLLAALSRSRWVQARLHGHVSFLGKYASTMNILTSSPHEPSTFSVITDRVSLPYNQYPA